jgi:hypothetical protein
MSSCQLLDTTNKLAASFHPAGVAKALGFVDISGGAPVLGPNLNVAAVVRTPTYAAGSFDISLNVTFPDTNIFVTATANAGASDTTNGLSYNATYQVISPSAIRVLTTITDNKDLVDTDFSFFVYHL